MSNRFDRRQILTAGGALALGACTAPLQQSGMRRPNILWLVSEDNNPFIGAYGDHLATTPNIDRLAGEGILYRNAYSNTPVCAPTRFTILTGVNAESCSPAHHMRASATLPREIVPYSSHLRQAGYYCTNNSKTDYNCDVDADAIWDENGPDAGWQNRPAGAPFMAVFNFMTTHESSLFRNSPNGVDPDTIRLPAYLPDLPAIRSDYARYYGLMTAMDAQVGEHLAALDAAGLADDTIVFYYSDNGGVLPRSKRSCNDAGLRCGLVVRVPEKWRHLAPFPAGSEVTSPISFVDLAPTLLSLAGISPPAIMQGTPFLGEAMAAPKTYAFGQRNRMDERYDMVRTVTDGRYRYIRNYMPFRPQGQVVAFEWLAAGYKAWHSAYLAGELNAAQSRFFEPREFEEFYDLQEDPDQITNLANNSLHRNRLDQFRSALDEHMLEINDNGFIPEGSSLEGYWQSRDPDRYPLAEIMTLASRAASGDPTHRSHFIGQLDHRNEAIRYWSAIGLLNLQLLGHEPASELLAAMRQDPSIPVRIVAAEALASGEHSQEAVEFLEVVLNGNHPMSFRLQAINSLTYIGTAAASTLPSLRVLLTSQEEYIARSAAYLVAVLEGRFDPSVDLIVRGQRPASA